MANETQLCEGGYPFDECAKIQTIVHLSSEVATQGFKKASAYSSLGIKTYSSTYEIRPDSSGTDDPTHEDAIAKELAQPCSKCSLPGKVALRAITVKFDISPQEPTQ